MPIHIREGADPLSDASLRSASDAALKNIQSGAGRVLRLELTRYCKGEVNGRSFLVAGHRGAGKTTTVADALDRVLRKSRNPGEGLLRPLPIFLHGPSLFEFGASDASDRAKGKRGAKAPDSIALQAEQALQQIILGVHRAVAKEFVRAYRERLVTDATYVPEPEQLRRAELAAQFEVELVEDPPAARLREFWDAAGALDSGVLFDTPFAPDQGGRELVALNGMCNAHQRISGNTNAQDKTVRAEDTVQESGWGLNAQTAELVKPVVSILAGAGVAGGVASGSAHLGAALFAGILTATAAAAFFKSSSSTSRKTGRQLDTVFIPDLTLKTLDRILPTLLDRLRQAGLAPVLVIDELDKVQGLPDRLVAMIHFLKKLVAENVFTCFLTDRAYMEHLRTQGRSTAYGRAYSYFSHPLLVTFRPADIARYLDDLLQVDEPLAGTAPPQATPAEAVPPVLVPDPAPVPAPVSGPKADPLDVDRIDLQLLKWVLRHRSQLHALALTRELSALRGDDGTVQIRPGAVRTELTYCIDVTLQVAIELQLRMPLVQGWLRQRPEMVQTLYDALYYVSRQWLAGAPHLDLGFRGRDEFAEALTSRMNLDELNTPGKAPLAASAPVVSNDDLAVLNTVFNGIVDFLSGDNDAARAKLLWESLPMDASESAALLLPEVMGALLLKENSLLVSQEGNATLRHWRYWPSGIERQAGETQAPGMRIFDIAELEPAMRSIEKIRAIERNLSTLLGQSVPVGASQDVFGLLQDNARVLPTTPAWSRVTDAIRNIDATWVGSANFAVSPEDLRAVKQFDAMLESRGSDVVRILAVARACSAFLRAEPEPGVGTGAALFILSGTLGFARVDTAAAANAVAGWQADVVRTYTTEDPGQVPQQPASIGLNDAGLMQAMDKALTEGRRLARQVKWERVVRDAWDGLRRRLTRFVEGGDEPPLELAEILCALAGKGPARWFDRPFASTTLSGWSTLFLNVALEPADPVEPGEENLPWLAVAALARLGARALPPDQIDALLDWLVQARGFTGEGIGAAAQILKRGRPASVPQEGAARVGICLSSGEYSAWYWWSNPPTKGLVFFFDSARLEGHWADLKSLMAVFPDPVPVTVDASSIGAESASNLITSGLGSDTTIVWIYSRRAKDMREPNIINPGGPDDVLDKAPRSAGASPSPAAPVS
ncbi:hypothetical protein [Piscinibacter sp. XHJ-5]|uniref:hypothetical protein n=1 Tax=Piscinibacter sp. XHJ-5 TaxID=3037797 RepID=UPI002452C396|nr:hypothetical protein [Piscinibacter sp. XHJ-5]